MVVLVGAVAVAGSGGQVCAECDEHTCPGQVCGRRSHCECYRSAHASSDGDDSSGCSHGHFSSNVRSYTHYYARAICCYRRRCVLCGDCRDGG